VHDRGRGRRRQRGAQAARAAAISSSAIDSGLRDTDVTWGGTIRPNPSPSWL